MNISFKAYDSLPKEAVFIRTTVFVDEQGFREEFDVDDRNALHILMFDGDKAIGTCRVIYSKKHESITVGRVAVLKEYRGKNLGKAMMLFCEKEIVNRYGEIQIWKRQQCALEEPPSRPARC